MERARWRDFRSLLDMKDRKLFDQMFSYVIYYNSNCMMQANPNVFYSVMISILFHHYKQLMNLKGMKNVLLPLSFTSSQVSTKHRLDLVAVNLTYSRIVLTGEAGYERLILAYFLENVFLLL